MVVFVVFLLVGIVVVVVVVEIKVHAQRVEWNGMLAPCACIVHVRPVE